MFYNSLELDVVALLLIDNLVSKTGFAAFYSLYTWKKGIMIDREVFSLK